MPELHAGVEDWFQDGSATDAANPPFAAHLFGPFRIHRDGDALNDAAGLRRTSARTLLKWFLLNPGVRVESVELDAMLWPSRRSRTCSNRLHVTLHYLRHLLEPNLAARQPSTFIRSDGKRRYWFDFAGSWWTDVAEVERLLAAGKAAEKSGDAEAAMAAYEKLLDYYDQTFLTENLFDDAFDSSRATHDVAHREVEERLLRVYLTQGLAHKALTTAWAILDRDPFSEAASTAIAEISLLQGNVLAARTQFAGYMETVHRELGVYPSQATRQLWDRIERAG